MVKLLPFLLGAIALYCLVIAIRPQWFRNFRIRGSDGDGDTWDDRSTRLGELSHGSVRVLCGVLAVFFVIAAFVVHGWSATPGP